VKSKPYKLLYWLPRILAIIAILFVSMFALDTFESGLSPWKQLMAYMMRLIPSYLLVALLILAWHREVVGGVLFIVVGLAFSPAVFMHNYHLNQSVCTSLGCVGVLTFPFVVIGGLFLVHHFKKKFSKRKYHS